MYFITILHVTKSPALEGYDTSMVHPVETNALFISREVEWTIEILRLHLRGLLLNLLWSCCAGPTEGQNLLLPELHQSTCRHALDSKWTCSPWALGKPGRCVLQFRYAFILRSPQTINIYSQHCKIVIFLSSKGKLSEGFMALFVLMV